MDTTIEINEPFDFDTPVERHATASLKWDKYKGRDVIPLWVADMDFRSPPAVIRALQHRVAYGKFEDAGVGLQDGIEFDEPGFVRLNFACPRGLLKEALQRMATALVGHFH